VKRLEKIEEENHKDNQSIGVESLVVEITEKSPVLQGAEEKKHLDEDPGEDRTGAQMGSSRKRGILERRCEKRAFDTPD